MDDVEDHDSSNQEADEDGTGTTLGEGTTGTDEETSTDGATDGNHVQVTLLHGTIELDIAGTIVTYQEHMLVGAKEATEERERGREREGERERDRVDGRADRALWASRNKNWRTWGNTYVVGKSAS